MLPKIAIFGTNTLASALITELQRLSFEIIGLWDQKLKTASAWSEEFSIPFATDCIETLLQNREVDLVIVCSPPYFHKEISTKALAAGKHVICEPPLGISNADIAAIMEQALYYPSLLTISTFGLRYVPAISRIKSLINDGFIGGVNCVEVNLHCGLSDLIENVAYDWTCIRQLFAGPLYTTALHVVDLITFLLGEKAYTVCGTVKRFQESPSHFKYDEHLTREDFVSWQMLLESNAPCTCTINNNFPGGKFDLRLVINGSQGTISIIDGTCFIQKYNEKEKKSIGLLLEKDLAIADLQMACRFDYRHPEVITWGMLELCSHLKKAFEPLVERRCFFAEILAEAGSFSNCQYARSVVDAIRRSSDNRRWTEVKTGVKKQDGKLLSLSHIQ